MRFCQICGRPLKEDERCDCRYRQSPSPAPIPQPAAESAAPPPAAKGDSLLLRTLRNIPIAFVHYWKDSPKIVETAQRRQDYPLAGIFIGVLFIMNALMGICFFGRMSGGGSYHLGLGILSGAFGGLYFRFHIGLVLLGALIVTVTAGVLFIGTRVLTQMIFVRRSLTEATSDAVIAFGLHAIPVSCLLVAGALLGLLSAWFVILFVTLAAAYYVTVGMIAAIKDSEGYRSALLRTAILAAAAAVAVGVAFRVLALVCMLNYSIVPKL